MNNNYNSQNQGSKLNKWLEYGIEGQPKSLWFHFYCIVLSPLFYWRFDLLYCILNVCSFLTIWYSTSTTNISYTTNSTSTSVISLILLKINLWYKRYKWYSSIKRYNIIYIASDINTFFIKWYKWFFSIKR